MAMSVAAGAAAAAAKAAVAAAAKAAVAATSPLARRSSRNGAIRLPASTLPPLLPQDGPSTPQESPWVGQRLSWPAVEPLPAAPVRRSQALRHRRPAVRRRRPCLAPPTWRKGGTCLTVGQLRG